MLKSRTIKSISLVLALVAAVSAQRVAEVTTATANEHVIKKVEPEYPAVARTARLQGKVTLKAIISKDGTVADAKTIDGHPLLIAAAISAVKQWQYKPFIVDGKPTEVSTVIEVPFSLGIPEADYKNERQINESYFQQQDKCREQLRTRQFAEAENICKAALETVQQLPESRQMERLTAYQFAGHALLWQKKFSDALAMYQHELKIAKATLQPHEAELGYAYRDVAVALHATGDLSEARSNYELAEGTLEQAREDIGSAFLKNKYSQTLQSMLRGHAVLLRQMGDGAAADAIEQKAKSIVVRTDLKDE